MCWENTDEYIEGNSKNKYEPGGLGLGMGETHGTSNEPGRKRSRKSLQ